MPKAMWIGYERCGHTRRRGRQAGRKIRGVSPKGFNNLLSTLSFSFPALVKASLSFRPTQLQVTLTGGVEAAQAASRADVFSRRVSSS